METIFIVKGSAAYNALGAVETDARMGYSASVGGKTAADGSKTGDDIERKVIPFSKGIGKALTESVAYTAASRRGRNTRGRANSANTGQ